MALFSGVLVKILVRPNVLLLPPPDKAGETRGNGLTALGRMMATVPVSEGFTTSGRGVAKTSADGIGGRVSSAMIGELIRIAGVSEKKILILIRPSTGI